MGMQRLSGLCFDATAKADDRLTEPAGNSSYPDGSFALECLPVKATFAGEHQIRTTDGSFQAHHLGDEFKARHSSARQKVNSPKPNPPAAPAPGVSRKSRPKVSAATSASRASPASGAKASCSPHKPVWGP